MPALRQITRLFDLEKMINLIPFVSQLYCGIMPRYPDHSCFFSSFDILSLLHSTHSA
jgi:hypothetical protein